MLGYYGGFHCVMCGDYWIWLNSGGLFVGRWDLLLRVSIILRIGLRCNWRVVVLR